MSIYQPTPEHIAHLARNDPLHFPNPTRTLRSIASDIELDGDYAHERHRVAWTDEPEPTPVAVSGGSVDWVPRTNPRPPFRNTDVLEPGSDHHLAMEAASVVVNMLLNRAVMRFVGAVAIEASRQGSARRIADGPSIGEINGATRTPMVQTGVNTRWVPDRDQVDSYRLAEAWEGALPTRQGMDVPIRFEHLEEEGVSTAVSLYCMRQRGRWSVCR